MKINIYGGLLLAATALIGPCAAQSSEGALLIVDLQVGLAAGVRDIEATLYKNNILAYASLGRIYKLPVVMTTSVESGPNGPLPREILEMYPTAPIIRRAGEVNAWDNPDFRAAIQATGKKQLIIAGITTDVCVAFLALSLRDAGYHVVVDAEACGTFNPRIAEHALNRMQTVGVQIMNFFSINGELFRDWRSTDPPASVTVPFLDKYIASESFVVRAHAAAVDNGTIVPGELSTVMIQSNDTCY